MKRRRISLSGRRAAALAAALAALAGVEARAYIDIAYTLGRILNESSNILLVQVDKVDRVNNVVTYRKVRDLKGRHPTEVMSHAIGQRGLHPREWQTIMAWADSGKTAVFFHNGASGEVCLDRYWYQVAAGDPWTLVHAEPMFLLSFAGRPEKLALAVQAMLDGQEVVVPCMAQGDMNALHLRTAKIVRMKAGLRIQDYNQLRDFAGWGDEEFQRIAGMRGFTHVFPLPSVGAGPAGLALTDLNADGKPDLCLFGETRVAVLKNADGVFNPAPLACTDGARAAAWADFDLDGKPDLLLATAAGPRLFRYDGDKFVDVSRGLPGRPYWALTAAEWIDADGDRRPDILLADSFDGLRLLRNLAADPTLPRSKPPRLGDWHYAGPFDNTDQKGFAAEYPPEKEVDLAREYTGKANEKVAWKKQAFADGKVNSLKLFKPECNDNVAVYLFREIEADAAAELPISLGSDDTLTVWLNGERLAAENVYRGCEPDQLKLGLKLKPGRNRLLLKICQGGGDFGFYFAAGQATNAVPPLFEDVSDVMGLGRAGVAAGLPGDHLAVCDVNGDGRPDFLYSAGTGVLALHTGRGFAEARDSGVVYRSGGVRPAFGDANGDGRPDLFVPQREGRSRLFLNAGRGRFTEATARAGALAEPLGEAVCAAWSDFDRRGRQDLLVGCRRGTNRYLRGNGDGTFTDATADIGFHARIFNTAGLAAADVNGDRVPDVVMANYGQGSVVLLGDPARPAAPASRGP